MFENILLVLELFVCVYLSYHLDGLLYVVGPFELF
jgi:hypothetical protein